MEQRLQHRGENTCTRKLQRLANDEMLPWMFMQNLHVGNVLITCWMRASIP